VIMRVSRDRFTLRAQCLSLSFKAFPASALAESCDSLWGTLSHAAGIRQIFLVPFSFF
jgi:hypothetical protein